MSGQTGTSRSGSSGRILVTPRGSLSPTLAGGLVEGRPRRAPRRLRLASTELDLHLRVYRRRASAARCPCHPPAATAFPSRAKDPGERPPEVAVLIGEVPLSVRPAGDGGARRRGRTVSGRARCGAAGQSRCGCVGPRPGPRPHPHGELGTRGPDPPGRPKPRPGDHAHSGTDARPRAAERNLPTWRNQPRTLTRPSKRFAATGPVEQCWPRLDSAGDKAPPRPSPSAQRPRGAASAA